MTFGLPYDNRTGPGALGCLSDDTPACSSEVSVSGAHVGSDGTEETNPLSGALTAPRNLFGKMIGHLFP